MDAGWARAWQEHLAPVTVGAFTIRPPWLEGSPSDLVIDPGPSFGAASHPTTRLCLELLQELDGRRARWCDWGAGSGVLAIAAARLGFAPVVAVELDTAAAHVAKRNARRNGVDVEVVVGDVTARRAVGATDRREPHAARSSSRVAARLSRRRRRGSSPPASSPRTPTRPSPPGPPASSSASGASSTAGPRSSWSARVIRLAVRVQREHAELVLTELMALAPGGLEERE